MSGCLQCGKACPPDFVTCSEECNVRYRAGGGREADPDGPLDVGADTSGCLKLGELTARLGVPAHRVYNGISCGRLRRGTHFFKVAPRLTMYDPVLIAEALGLPTDQRPPADELDAPVGHAVADSVPLDDGTGDHVVAVQVRTAAPNSGEWSEALFHESQRPKRPAPAPDEVGSMLQVETIRTRGLAAAKEAFRDVLLEEADGAKERGDYRLQARLLEDFIHFEQGLRLIYEGRAGV